MDRLIPVDTERVGTGSLSQGRGIQRRPRDHIHDEVRVLRMRNENLRHRLTSRPIVTGVAHHANHFIGIRSTLVVENQVTSNGVLSAPRLPRELLIDDHDTRSVSVITVRELAPGDQRKAQCPEVAGCRHPNAGLRHHLAFGPGLLGPVRPSEIGADRAHRQSGDSRAPTRCLEPRGVN